MQNKAITRIPIQRSDRQKIGEIKFAIYSGRLALLEHPTGNRRIKDFVAKQDWWLKLSKPHFDGHIIGALRGPQRPVSDIIRWEIGGRLVQIGGRLALREHPTGNRRIKDFVAKQDWWLKLSKPHFDGHIIGALRGPQRPVSDIILWAI